MQAPDILKYPRTVHLLGSALQKDDGTQYASWKSLEGCTVAYEEKVDGANCAFRFDAGGNLWAQSRGHYLKVSDRNAPRERDWVLLKEWLNAHETEFLERFEDRYIVYGEWMAITHSVFYNNLPSLFLEFDIYDLQNNVFLDTPSRKALCEGLPILSVPVLYRGDFQSKNHMLDLIGPSAFRTPQSVCSWQSSLKSACSLVNDDFASRLVKMDASDNIEGIYIKVEKDGETVGRFKWVRAGFVQTIMDSDEHWQSRFPVPNLLEAQTDVFPAYLARKKGVISEYCASKPWEFAPWIVAQAEPNFIPR